MQFRFIFLLITRVKIVIYTVLAVTILACQGCGGKEPVFINAQEDGGGSTDSGASCESVPDDGSGAMDVPDKTAGEGNSGPSSICVFVCGAVECEGVYELPAGSRVIDAVNAAGGYSEDADRTYVNQAQYVTDTEKVEIPTESEALELRNAGLSDGWEAEDSGKGGLTERSGKVNINTAGADELMTLPGIGESKASKIIEYRESHGRFGAAEEIMNVSGIGSSVFDKLKDRITVE